VLLLLLACAAPPTVRVWIEGSEPDLSLTVEAVTLRPEGLDWEADWEPLAATEEAVGLGELVADGPLSAGRYEHVFVDVGEALLAGEPLVDVVEPIAAPRRLRPGSERTLVVTLLVHPDENDAPALFAVDTRWE
jgi:hypothetical protein